MGYKTIKAIKDRHLNHTRKSNRRVAAATVEQKPQSKEGFILNKDEIDLEIFFENSPISNR